MSEDWPAREEKKHEEPRRLAPTVEKQDGAYLSWSADEYERREHGKSWYAVVGVFAAALVALAIIAKSYFFVAFVALAFAVLLLYTKRPPRQLAISIERDGVRVGKRLYEFSALQSFWIFERADVKELSLETKQTFQPYLHLPLGDTDPEKIREILLSRLPEKEQQETVIDQLARSFGF